MLLGLNLTILGMSLAMHWTTIVSTLAVQGLRCVPI
jgi:hypothetical protein